MSALVPYCITGVGVGSVFTIELGWMGFFGVLLLFVSGLLLPVARMDIPPPDVVAGLGGVVTINGSRVYLDSCQRCGFTSAACRCGR